MINSFMYWPPPFCQQKWDRDMETKERGRHRLGGRHSDPIIVPSHKKPSGRRAAKPVEEVTAPVAVIPPPPTREPVIHTGKVDTVVAPPKTGMIRVVKHKGKLNALTAIATGGLLIVGGGATAAAHKPMSNKSNERTAVASDHELELSNPQPITVPIDVIMNQTKVDVQTTAAPPPPPPPPAVVAPAPVVKPAPAPAPAPAVTAPVYVDGGRAATISAAALSQLGVYQDCTRLVSNSLAAAGINHHGWPISYYSIGRPVTRAEAIPGDLIYYANGGTGLAHIAVYIGNGQAVHGGWNGNQTVIFSAQVGSGPQFIRV